MQIILIYNLILQFVAITSKTFSPLYALELVHISLSFEFRHRFAFRLDYSLTSLIRLLLKKNKQQNVILTKLLFTFFAIDILKKLL